MEKVVIKLDDGTGKAYDEALASSHFPDIGDLAITTKDNGTVGGNPVAIITFSVHHPVDGVVKVHTTTTLAALRTMLSAVVGKYGHY